MRNPLADTIVNIKPSGIRKFFDLVSEMKDAISLGVASRTLIHRGISAMRVSTLWREVVPFIHPMQV